MDAEDSKSSAFPDAALLVGAAQSVWQGSDSRVTIEIHAESKLRRFMSERGIKSLERVYITDSDIRHIMNRNNGNCKRDPPSPKWKWRILLSIDCFG